MLVTFQKSKSLYDQGMEAHQQGRLQDAVNLYRQVLATEPNHADALHLFGLCLHQSGNPQMGADMMVRSLQLNPMNAAAVSNLAEVRRCLGQFQEAEALCHRAMSMAPNLAAPYINLGMVLHQQGRTDDAIKAGLRAIELDPRQAAGYAVVGMCLGDTNRFPEAIRYLEEAVRLNPNDAAVASSLGICYMRMEAYDKAHEALKRAVALAPEHPQVLTNMGSLFAQMERFADAVPWFEKILAKDPNSLISMEYLASLKTSLKQFEEAIAMCRQILVKNPRSMEAYANIGEALMGLGRYDETIATLHEALKITRSAGVLQSLSNAYVRSGHPETGLDYINQSLAIEPQNAVLHFNKSVILMMLGRLAEAWPEFEWRWQHPRMVGRNRRFNKPEWDGSPLNGKRVLLHAEQGMGDTIFFGRYATLVAEQKGGVPIMWVQDAMVDLVKTIRGVGEVIGERGPFPAFDCHLPIMSLPRVFGTTLENIPVEMPYIKTKPDKSAHWKKWFAEKTGKFKVGLVWEGGAFQPENFLRSNSLAAYAPLADVEGVAFFGLQKGPAEPQCKNPPEGMDFTNLAPYLNDFSDTAAILENIDLLISIDTSVIHVAAALNKPVWMLMAWSPGHMWMFKREDTPWYPTVRIFRQPAFKDWATPVGRIKEELVKLLASRQQS